MMEDPREEKKEEDQVWVVKNVSFLGAAAYQLGNIRSLTITEIKQC